MKKLLIMGCGGHGRVSAEIAKNMKIWDEISFLNDFGIGKKIQNFEIIDCFNSFGKYIQDWDLFVAIGDNLIRKKIIEKLIEKNANLPVLIHKSAVIGEEVKIGKGTVVGANAVINCCSDIGIGSIINTGTIVEHDCKISSFVHLSPGVSLAGGVKIGSTSWIGIGSSIIEKVIITDFVIVGAGTIVICDINEGGTYVGMPIRKIKDS